jgi:hypothetical protein
VSKQNSPRAFHHAIGIRDESFPAQQKNWKRYSSLAKYNLEYTQSLTFHPIPEYNKIIHLYSYTLRRMDSSHYLESA